MTSILKNLSLGIILSIIVATNSRAAVVTAEDLVGHYMGKNGCFVEVSFYDETQLEFIISSKTGYEMTILVPAYKLEELNSPAKFSIDKEVHGNGETHNVSGAIRAGYLSSVKIKKVVKWSKSESYQCRGLVPLSDTRNY